MARKRQLLLAVAVVASLVAALLLYWRDRGAGHEVAPTPAHAAQPAGGHATTPAPSPALPTAEPARRQAPITLTPAVAGPDPDAGNGVLAGRVVNGGTGHGVNGAELVFSRGSDGITVRAGGDGAFAFAAPEPGHYRLAVASADGYLPYAPAWNRSPIEVVARPGVRIEGIVVYLSPAVDYTGVVRAPSGKPVAGATVHLLGADTGERALSPLPDTFHSDAAGEFTFHAPDFAVLEAVHPDYAAGHAVLDGDAQITHRLEIHLGTGAASSFAQDDAPRGKGRIVGRVTAGGKPVAAFTAVALQRDGVAERVVASESFFDGEGRFELGGLVPGDYIVRATAYGYAQSEARPARASESPGRADEVEIVLPRGGTLVGTVVNATTKKPLANARVTVEGGFGQGASALPTSSSAVTDDDGSFELSGLPPGAASVVAAAYRHNSRIVGGLQVSDGARLGPISIALTPLAEGERPKLELAGIGAVLSATNDGLRITQLIEGGGAADAGMLAGDVITAIDGQSVSDLGMNGAIQRIRGVVGTTVTLSVRRGDQVREVVATRKKISV